MRKRLIVAIASALAASTSLALPGVAQAAATSPTSPVNLATPIDFAAAVATNGAVVSAGDARFEVLGSGLIRMEYSPSANFEDLPTVNVIDRHFAVPSYTATTANGWLTITTSAATLRYRVGSGPFDSSNVSVSYADAGKAMTESPQWENECPFDQVCDAGAATLVGPANIETNHANYNSIAGFIAGLGQANSAGANWTVLNAPAGGATVTLRYANYVGALGGPAARNIDVVVNGTDVGPVNLPPTTSWDTWATASTTVTLKAGTNTVGLLCGSSDSCTVNVDTLSVAPTGAPAPTAPDLGYLGGYTRGFDTATYGPKYSCPAGTPTAAQCAAALPQMHPGILDTTGYRLLDDTDSAVWNKSGWVDPRPANGDVQDGYLFVYGDNYAQALENLNSLTGPSPLLDESNFGVWYSDYYAYTTADYENTLIPAFRANNVPLDDLSIDTDWKAPETWDGWEWNSSLFPDPQAFLNWAKSQGINVTLNIHASIPDNDPQLAATQAIAGTTLPEMSGCFAPSGCKTWDWSSVSQAESYFNLLQPYEQQGVGFWWLDWCCDNSTASNPGVTPDAWINHLQAIDLSNKGQRGFVLSRTGSSYQNPDEVYPAGPWAGHTSTLAFTGDTWGTWNTLAFQAQLSADEASIDQPYVSNDIGSFLGPPPGNAQDDADLYSRWVQLGTFQPVLRLHSSAGNRLPWEYPQPADAIASNFLRLREALVPYTYTLAEQSVTTGLPITQPLYLDYPTEAQAYSNPMEYLYGPDVLVAPVTTPGTVATESVWFPPGTWTDYFTGATFQGPSTQTLTVPLDRMPVFVKAGGIIPEQAPMEHVNADPTAPTTLLVYPGAGKFSLYQDAGTGLGYQKGQDSVTSISSGVGTGSNSSAPSCPSPASPASSSSKSSSSSSSSADPTPAVHNGLVRAAMATAATPPVSSPDGPGTAVTTANSSTVVIGPSCGAYPGQQTSRSFNVELTGITSPSVVLVDGTQLPSSGWTYDAATHTVTVPVSGLGLKTSATVTQIGGTPVRQSEPAALAQTITPATPLSLNPGQSTTVTTSETNAGPASATDLSTTLTGPSGWTIAATGATTTASLAAGGSASQSWTVTAPSGGSAAVSASLVATTTYTSAGQSETVTASEQAADATAPLPPPVITATNPSNPAPGDAVTITGTSFGATQGSSYLTLAQGGTSWGAPYDGAKVTITNWSDTSITFDLPPDSGPYPLVPGSATVTVTVAGQSSAAAPINVAGTVATPPAITAVTPSTTTAGSEVTLTGTNFGTAPGTDSYLLLVQGGTSWGAPYDGAKLTIVSWSPTSIVFDLPTATYTWPLKPGSATISVTASGQTSNTEALTITS